MRFSVGVIFHIAMDYKTNASAFSLLTLSQLPFKDEKRGDEKI
jgi:hypothetical protein